MFVFFCRDLKYPQTTCSCSEMFVSREYGIIMNAKVKKGGINMEAYIDGQIEEAFVVGDIHGMKEPLDELLTHWQPDQQQLIFVGDYVDRGPQSKNTLLKVRQLQTDHGAICLRGNHEEMFLAFLQNPISDWTIYERNGGLTTVAQLLGESTITISQYSRIKLARLVNEAYPWLENWLSELPYFVEFGRFIVVHAGLNLHLEDWRQTSKQEMTWIRQDFHETPNQTGKSIIFGHTPVMSLHKDRSAFDIWKQDEKFGIDGGAVYGGSLLALKVTRQRVKEMYQVRS